MGLNQSARIAGVGLQVQHPIGVGVEHRISLDLLVAWQANDRAVARRHFELSDQCGVGYKAHGLNFVFGLQIYVILACSPRPTCARRSTISSIFFGAGAPLLRRLFTGGHVGAHVGLHPARFIHTARVNLEPPLAGFIIGPAHKCGATHIGNLLHGDVGGQPVRNFNNGALGVAVQQQVALGIHHNGAAHFVAPVVVVRNAAQASFNATQNNGHVFKRFTAALAVHNGGTVWALATDVAWRVGIVTADFSVCRVAVDHGVHVARGHPPKQIGFAQGLERLGAGPVRLGDDAHPKTLRFQHAPNHGHAKTGVVNVGVARDQNNVAAVPAKLLHFGP